jgi:hypothetical protein
MLILDTSMIKQDKLCIAEMAWDDADWMARNNS